MGEVNSLVRTFNKAKHAPKRYYLPLPKYGTTLPNLKKYKIIPKMLERTQGIRCLCMLPDGRLIIGAEYGTLIIFDLLTYKQIFQFIVIEKATLTNVYLFDDNRILVTSSKGELSMWSILVNSSKEIFRIRAHNTYIYRITKLPRQRIATCSSDKTIKIFCSEIPFKNIITLRGHFHEITSLLNLKNTELLLSASIGNDSTIRVWNMITYKCDTVIKQATKGYNTAMIEAEDKNIIIGGGGIVSILQYDNMKFNFLMRFENESLSKVFPLTILSNGLVLGLSSNGVLTVINTNQNVVHCKTEHNDLYLTTLLDVASDTFISGDREGKLIIWKY